MTLDVEISEETIVLKGRVPDKVFWILVMILLGAMGMEADAIQNIALGV